MRVAFSKNRAAQLDLLLRSIERNMEPEDTKVIWRATNDELECGYGKVVSLPHVELVRETDFNDDLRHALVECRSETVTFFCDDDIVFRPVPDPARLLDDDQVLTVCLYLGRGNVKMDIPKGFPVWRWRKLPRHDFGFPTAIDGNTYRVKDVLALIGGDNIPNPTMLETVMALRVEGIASQRPLMTSFEEQCLVGVSVNRVSDQSGVHFGLTHPQTTVELNDRFLAGERIDLEALDFSGVNSCHHEISFVWEPRP